MATKKKTKSVKRYRQLTRVEKTALSEFLYKYINRIDRLLEKDLNVQVKYDLKKLQSAVKKITPYLRRF